MTDIFSPDIRPVYLLGASRSASMRFSVERHESFSALLAREVARLPRYVLDSLKTIYVVHRYPIGGPFAEAEFLERAQLPTDESIAVNYQTRTFLGGLRAVHDAIGSLQSMADDSSTLIVGGEVFNPNTPAIDFAARRHALAEYAGLPQLETDIGLTSMSANALLADSFFRQHGMTGDQIETLFRAVTCHLERFAYLNSNAYQHGRRELARVTPELYRSRLLKEGRRDKWPFHVLDSCAISNGAAAIVLSNKKPEKGGVRVACCHIESRDASRSLLHRAPGHSANAKVWERVWDSIRASYRDWGKEHRPILELYDSFAYQVPMTLVEMGLYRSPQEVTRDFEDGLFSPENPNARVILNPSGGSKDGHPTGAFHLVKLADTFTFLTTPEQIGRIGFSRAPGDLPQWGFVHYVHVANSAGVLALERV